MDLAFLAGLFPPPERGDDLPRVLAQQPGGGVDQLQLPLHAQRRAPGGVPPDSHRRPPPGHHPGSGPYPWAARPPHGVPLLIRLLLITVGKRTGPPLATVRGVTWFWRSWSVEVGRLVPAPDLAERVADLAPRGAVPQRLAQRDQQVLAAGGGLLHVVDAAADLAGVPLAAQRGQPAGLLFLELGIEPQRLVGLVAGHGELVDPDHHPFPGVDLPGHLVGRALDLRLLEAP